MTCPHCQKYAPTNELIAYRMCEECWVRLQSCGRAERHPNPTGQFRGANGKPTNREQLWRLPADKNSIY